MPWSQDKEVRPALGLVEDRARGEPRQETPGVLLREGALGRVLQTDIGPVGEERAGERSLAGLARAGQGEDREAGRQAAQRGFDLAIDRPICYTNRQSDYRLV